MNKKIEITNNVWTDYNASLESPIEITKTNEYGTQFSTITTVRNASRKMREALNDMIHDSNIVAVTMSFANHKD